MNGNRLAWGIAAVLIAAVLMVVMEPFGNGLSEDNQEFSAENGPNGATTQEAEIGDLADANALDGDRNLIAPEQEPDLTSEERRQKEMGTPSFTGRIANANNRPVPAAQILAVGFPGRARGFDPSDRTRRAFAQMRATSDQHGRFSLPESPHEGLRWVLRIQHPEHPLFEITDLSSIPGRTRDLGNLILQQGASLQGQVTDVDGYPLLNATVEALRGAAGLRLSKWLEADSFPLPDATARTAGDGTFTLNNLPPGPVRLRASSPGFVESISAEAHLEAGEMVKGLQLVLPRSLALNGTVRSLDGVAITTAEIRATWSPPGESIAKTDEAGNFALELPREATAIRIDVSAPNHARLMQRIPEKIRQQNIEIRLADILPLHGRVVDDRHAGIAGATIGLFEQSRMRMARVAPDRSSAITQTTADSQGYFKLPVDPGDAADRRLRLIAWADGYQPNASNTLRFEQRDSKVPVALQEEFILMLEPGAGLTGTVRDSIGTPIPGARVHLRRHGGSSKATGLSASLSARDGEIAAVTTTTMNGSYRLPDIPDGAYHLEAFHSGYSPGRSDEFAIFKSESQQFDIQLAAAAGIQGKIHGDRSRLGPLRLQAYSEAGRIYSTTIPGPTSTTTPTPPAEFQLEELPPGIYRLELYATASSPQSAWGRPRGPLLCAAVEALVHEGQTTAQDLELDFEELASLHGEVLVNGLPTADYRIFLLPAGYESATDKEQRRRVMDQLRSTASNVDGKFAFEGLGSHEFWLVLAPPLGNSNGNIGVTGLSGSIGGLSNDQGPSGLARARVELGSGERARHTFHLQTAALAGTAMRKTSTGTIALRSGIGYLRPGPEHQGVRRFTFPIRRDGTFHVPAVPAGNWLLELRSGSFRLKRENILLVPGGLTQREYTLDRVKGKSTSKQESKASKKTGRKEKSKGKK